MELSVVANDINLPSKREFMKTRTTSFASGNEVANFGANSTTKTGSNTVAKTIEPADSRF